MKSGIIRQDSRGTRYLVIGKQPDGAWATYNLTTKEVNFCEAKDFMKNTKPHKANQTNETNTRHRK